MVINKIVDQYILVHKCSSYKGGRSLNIQVNKILTFCVKQKFNNYAVSVAYQFCFSAMRVIGPILLVIGLAMVISGVVVCIHYRKQLAVPNVLYVSRRRFLCINVGSFY